MPQFLLDPTEETKERIKAAVLERWEKGQREIISHFEGTYTNWNSCITGLKEETRNFCKPDISSGHLDILYNAAMNSGDFSKIDSLYQSIVWHMNRHIAHSGPDGLAGIGDYCATSKKVKVNDDPVEYEICTKCKRRKPQIETEIARIYRDPHDDKFYQLTFPNNDGRMNGHSPHEILLTLGNVDFKVIPPMSFARAPEIEFDLERRQIIIRFFSPNGDPVEEYVLKYVTKCGVPPATDRKLLALVTDGLRAAQKVTAGHAHEMYVKSACDQEHCIFETVQINLGLPLFVTNMEIQNVSLSNTHLLKSRYDKSTDDALLKENQIDKFNRRFLINAKLARDIKEKISLRDFFTSFEFDTVKGKDVIKLRSRFKHGFKKLVAVNATPLLSYSDSNPDNRRRYAYFCKVLYLWYVPCRTIDLPLFDRDRKEEEDCYWIQKFNDAFENGEGLFKIFENCIQHRNKLVPDEVDVEEMDEEIKRIARGSTIRVKNLI